MILFFWKKKLFSWGIFLWCAVFFPAKATGPERWMQATSQKALQQEIQKEQLEKKQRTLCLLQIKKKQVPYSCYEWSSRFFIPKKGRATKAPSRIFLDSIRSKQAFLNYLNEKCQSFAPNLKDLQKISFILKIKAIHPFCRKQVKKQKQIREYQLRDESPEKLLKWHYPRIEQGGSGLAE